MWHVEKIMCYACTKMVYHHGISIVIKRLDSIIKLTIIRNTRNSSKKI